MKVLWLSHLVPYPPKGGVLQRSYHLVRELARYNEVDLLCFNQKALMGALFESVPVGMEEARAVLSGFCGKFEAHEIPSDSSGFGRYGLALKSLFYEPYTINWLKSGEFASVLSRWLKQKDYYLVHFDTISLLPYFHIVPPGGATTLDHHNIESAMLLRRATQEPNLLKWLYFRQEGLRLARYEKKFCPRFSINITCSDLDSKRLKEVAPDANVCTVPNGVDLDYFRPQGVRVKPDRLIFVGRMSWYPNISAVEYIAKRLWPVLKQKRPGLECHIIGANPPKSICDLSDKLSGFYVRGFVDDIRPDLESAAVYVCPIMDGGGTKLKILDAMAMEKAIVAHPVACEGIDVTHGQDIMIAETENHFIQYIEKLLDSSSKREAMGSAARRLVEQRYSYPVIGKKMNRNFSALVESGLSC